MKISAVRALIGANILAYALQSVTSPATQRYFELWPLQPFQGKSYFHPWQLLSYSFLHLTHGIRALPHLLVNMFGIWLFGRQIERALGPGRFLLCYFGAVSSAALAHLFIQPRLGLPPHPIIGASGGVFGLLCVYACLFPQHLFLQLPYVPIRAWMVALVLGALELLPLLMRTFTGYPNVAHLGGMLGGFLVLMLGHFARSRT